DIDRTDSRVSVRTAHERGVCRAGQRYVVGEPAAPREKTLILASQDASTEHRATDLGSRHGMASSLHDGDAERRVNRSVWWLLGNGGGHLLGGCLHRFDDVVISRAPAHVALETDSDLLIGRM